MGDKDERNIPADQSAPDSDAARGINPVQHSERGINPVQHSERGINPVQHSERGINPVQHSERGAQQPPKDKPLSDDDERTAEGTGGRAGEYK
ncbi:MAG: hypothetical protein LC800_22090 [Acidobacteria bacterium]|nr:hypothetical protein [Acidobacteriota bacterium]